MGLKIKQNPQVINWSEKQVNKVKFINEKKDRVTVLHIENFTKPLY